MLAQLTHSQTLPASTHLLVLIPKSKALSKDAAHGALLKRRDMKVEALAKSPVAGEVNSFGMAMLKGVH